MNRTLKPSPAQRRKAAIAKRYQPWSLTNGKPSRWLHIGASFSALQEFATLRARWGFLTVHDKAWHLAFRVPDIIRHSRFNLSLYPARLP